MWKSTLKRYHAQKFSVKPHIKNVLNLLLQMHDFLLLGGFFGSNGLNRYGRLVHMLEFIIKNIFKFKNIKEISLTENRLTLDAYKYFLYQTFPGFSIQNDRLDPPLLKLTENPCAKLRENSVLAVS